jgi:hypothetical protein
VTVVPKGFEFDDADLPVSGRVAHIH